MNPPHLILCNLGTPAAPTEEGVRLFLKEFLTDPMVVDLPRWLWLPLLHGIILRKRPARVAAMYREIWTDEGSPLDVQSRKIAAAVSAAVGSRARVHLAYRYGTPALSALLPELLDREPGPITVVPLFPQATGATTGTVERMVLALARPGSELKVAMPAPDDPDYIEALADRCRASFAARDPDHLLLSFHGLPERMDRREGQVYSRDCTRTADCLLEALAWDRSAATLCYQSRFGPGAWLEPNTAGLLESLPGRGVRRLAVVCPGFLTDGLETVHEIGIEGEKLFLQAGGEELILVPAAADHPALIRALSRFVPPP